MSAFDLKQILPSVRPSMRSEAAMATWIVRATWIEDEGEVSERWEVNAATAHEAVEEPKSTGISAVLLYQIT